MFISDFAIKRPVVTVVSMVALSLFGVISLLRLKTDEFPDVQAPFVAHAQSGGQVVIRAALRRQSLFTFQLERQRAL